MSTPVGKFSVAAGRVISYIRKVGSGRHPVRRPIVQSLRHSRREECALMDEGRFSISARDLYRQIGTAAAPLVTDVRRGGAFDDDDRMLISAVRREPGEGGEWCRQLRPDQPVVVYCVH